MGPTRVAPGKPKEVAFVIGGKAFRYTGHEHNRERDFFQVYVKARSGRGQDVGTVEEAVAAFRENLPESDLSDDALEMCFIKHERRRAERDQLAAQQRATTQDPLRKSCDSAPASTAPASSNSEGSHLHDPKAPQAVDDNHSPSLAVEEDSGEWGPHGIPQPTHSPELSPVAMRDPSQRLGAEPQAHSQASWPPSPASAVAHSGAPPSVRQSTTSLPLIEQSPVSRAAYAPSLTDALNAQREETSSAACTAPVEHPEECGVLGSPTLPGSPEGCRTARSSALASQASRNGNGNGGSGNDNPLRVSTEGNAGWAADPVRKDSTAWEREMVRRQKRQEQEHKDRKERQQQQQQQQPPQPSPTNVAAPVGQAAAAKPGDTKKQNKDRKKDKGDEKGAAKQSAELLKTVQDLQTRVAQVEEEARAAQPAHLVTHSRDIITLVRRGAAGECLLHAAVVNGSLEDLARLLAMGAVADQPDESGRTPFMLAAERGHLTAVHLLASKGANVGGVDKIGRGAVALAAMGSHTTTVEYLCHRGCDPNEPDVYGRAPLHFAVGVRCGALCALLNMESIRIDARDKILYQTPLHYAAAGGYTAAIGYLLSAGAMITSVYNGNGPLALAALASHREAIREFVTRTSAARGWYALHECIISGGDLPATAMSGRLGGSPGALDFDINEPDAAGQTPIFLATMTPRTENVDYIVSLRASLKVKDKMKRTVLHYVAARGQLQLCRTLLQAGGFTDCEDEDHLSPYQLATLRGHSQLARLLLDYGASHAVHSTFERLCEISRRQAPSRCALVTRAYRRDVVKHRFTSDAPVADEHGRTALHVACLVGDEAGVRYLLQKALRGEGGVHASVTATDDRGWAALHWAACRDAILDDERNDLSAVPLTQPSTVARIKLEASQHKTAHQIRIVKMLLLHNMSLQSQGAVAPALDLRTLRDHAGRLPVDVAKREGADPDVATLLHTSAPFPNVLHAGPRWGVLALVSVVWGLFLAAPLTLYYAASGRPLKDMIVRPFNAIVAFFESTGGRMRRCIRGEPELSPQRHWQNYVRLFRIIAWLGVVLCFLLAALLPYWIVVAHRPPSNEPDDTFSLPPSANATSSPMGTQESGVRGKAVRNTVLSVLGLILFIFGVVTAARVFFDRKSGQLVAKMVARKPDFGKLGNWVAVVLGILDLLMLCAVPFVIVNAGGGRGVARWGAVIGGGDDSGSSTPTTDADADLPEAIAAAAGVYPPDRSAHRERMDTFVPQMLLHLVLEKASPHTAWHVSVMLLLGWWWICGLGGVSVAVSSNEALAKRFSIVRPHSFSTALPFVTHFFSHTLFIPIVLAILKVYKCDYSGSGDWPHTVGDPSELCYTGRRAAPATIAMLLVLSYTLTAGGVGVLLGEPHGAITDIVWGRHVLAAEKAAFLLMCLISTIWWELQWLCEVVYLLTLFCLVIFLTRFHGSDVTNALPFVHQWRMLGYGFAGIALVISVVLYGDTDAAQPDAGTLVSAILFIIFILLTWGVYRYSMQKYRTEQRAQAFRQLSASKGGIFAASTSALGSSFTSSLQQPQELPLEMSDPGDGRDAVDDERPGTPGSPQMSNFGLSFDTSVFARTLSPRASNVSADHPSPPRVKIDPAAPLAAQSPQERTDAFTGGPDAEAPRTDPVTSPGPPLDPDGWVLVGLSENMPQMQSYSGWVV